MTTTLEPLIAALKAARLARKLSQRALGAKAGIPQSHLSNIEAGRVDLTASSLIALARALELDLMLVPRQLVPAVKSILHVSDRGRAGQYTAADSVDEVSSPVPPAYSLDDEPDEGA